MEHEGRSPPPSHRVIDSIASPVNSEILEGRSLNILYYTERETRTEKWKNLQRWTNCAFFALTHYPTQLKKQVFPVLRFLP